MMGIHEIDGYGIVLVQVQNYYPVEQDSNIFSWGFKYTSGVFEFFHYTDKKKAEESRQDFVNALNRYLESR